MIQIQMTVKPTIYLLLYTHAIRTIPSSLCVPFGLLCLLYIMRTRWENVEPNFIEKMSYLYKWVNSEVAVMGELCRLKG